MSAVNINFPDKLRKDAEELVDKGLFVSFSDLVRHAVRGTVVKSRYELMSELAVKADEEGKLKVLKTDKDIDNYFKSL
jgi:Arc/MetJ-type ribon-helix-helix transcriptional regulator